MTITKNFTWNPTRITLFRIFESRDKKLAFKSFRGSSGGFINKPAVREHIFNKHNNKCCICGDNNNLEVDHIISVWYCFHNDLIYNCNTIDNLQLLCKSCNLSKQP